ncbi:hypothetical protein EII20_03125 [Comamonadaceae bacterium OH2545_COT-014]|nr:hypothetical protein EII20_03125 [Comamonadaceae bacterium OH2545_COT-014]
MSFKQSPDFAVPAAARRTWAALALAMGLGAAPAASFGFAGVFDAATQDALRSVGGSLMDRQPVVPDVPSVSGLARGKPGAAPATAAPSASAGGAKAPGEAAALNPSAYEFRYSAPLSVQVRNEVIQSLVDLGKRKGTMDAAGEQKLRETFGKIDIVKAVEQAMQGKGYKVHSLATAATYWLLVNYNIVRGVVSTDAQDAAVLKQMQARMSASPAMQSMTDAQKQRGAEGMFWFATLQQYGYEQAKQGVAGYDMKTVVSDARDALKTFGIDADQLALTDQGLQPK